ncbi:chloride channel protein [Streptococcus thermophilus]|nr:chloride channel protein [Streptococcus thermophilus]MCE2229222.1 chloride channel protein [Streptococcus thermophilus]
MGALFGGSLSKGLHLFISDRQLLIACGAGAGLVSVYQVPFASAFFVLETLGVCWKLKNIIIILATTYVSAYCAKPIIGGHTLYIVDKVTIDSSSFIQAIILALFVTPQFLWETDRF